VEFLYRWRRPLVAVLLVLVLTALLSYTAKLRGRVLTIAAAWSFVTAPATDALTVAGERAGGAVSAVGHLAGLEAENQKLKQELALYNSMKQELAELAADNARLRSLLYLKRTLGTWKLEPAAVIARNPDQWFDTVTVNAGSTAGVRAGMPVLVPEGVVGRVTAVSPTTAQVMLLPDPASGVGALDVRSRVAGVVLGSDPVTGTLSFRLFTQHPDVLPGDTIVTSGFSQFFPPGLLIGRVTVVRPGPYGLTETATVVPAVDFNRLETVMIVLAHPSGGSAPPLITGVP
jgi:rod shape-determining protein MreC